MLFLRASLAALLLLSATSASAEERLFPTDNMLELGIFSGAFVPSQNHELYDSTQSFPSPLNRIGPTLSLRAAYFPLAWVGAELEGGVMPQKNARDESVNLFTARAHGVFQLPWRVTPFVVAGGGYLGSRSEVGHDVDRSLHWGAGLKFYAAEWLSVRADGRQIWTAAEGPGAGNTSHFEVTAGLTFTLWREDEEPPPVVFVAEALAAPEPQPEPEPEPEPVEPDPIEVVQRLQVPARQVVEELGRVFFPWGIAKLRPNNYPALDRAVSLLKEHLELRVQVGGHADSTGPDQFNLALSTRRARAVVDYLVNAGVESERLSVRGFGEWHPVESNATRAGRAKNRRCEIRVVDARGNELAINPEED
ncbi:MAG: OmpA family protein [Deltaproteobacteria bacterium]